MLMNKKISKRHKATFLALPITIELTVVPKPDITWHPMPITVTFNYNCMRIKLVIVCTP